MSTVTYKAGKNALQVIGSNTHNYTSLKFNGSDVLTGYDIEEALSGFVGGVAAIVKRNTASVSLYGKGTKSDPIYGDISINSATVDTVGITKIPAVINSAKDTGVAIKAVNDLLQEVNGKALKSVTINGYTLDENIVLTRADFGLTAINNTADLDKPISIEQQQALDSKIEISHRHNVGGEYLPVGSKTTLGRLKLTADPAVSDPNTATTPKALKLISEKLSTVRTLASTKMPIDVMNVRKWEARGTVTKDGWTLKLPPDAVIYANQQELKFSDYELAIAQVPNATFHLYAYVDGDFPEYIAVQTKLRDLKYYYIGEFTTNASGIANIPVWNPATSFGNFRELEEHLAAAKPHKLSPVPSPADIGLDKIRKNWYMYEHITPGVPRAVMGWRGKGLGEFTVSDDNGLAFSKVNGYWSMNGPIPCYDALFYASVKKYLKSDAVDEARATGCWWSWKGDTAPRVVVGAVDNLSLELRLRDGKFVLMEGSNEIYTSYLSLPTSMMMWVGAGTVFSSLIGDIKFTDVQRPARYIFLGTLAIILEKLSATEFNVHTALNGNIDNMGNLFSDATAEQMSKINSLFDSDKIGFSLESDGVLHDVDYEVGPNANGYVSALAAVDVKTGQKPYSITTIDSDQYITEIPLPPGYAEYFVTLNMPEERVDGLDIKIEGEVATGSSLHIQPKFQRYEYGIDLRAGYKIEADTNNGPLTRPWPKKINVHCIKSYG